MAEDYYAVEKIKEEQKKSRVKVEWAFKGRKIVKKASAKKKTLIGVLAVIGTLSGAAGFLAALVVKDTVQASLMESTKKMKWYWRVSMYLLFGVVISGAITGVLAIWRNGVQEEVAQTEADEKAEEERRKLCSDMLLKSKKENDPDVLKEYIKIAKKNCKHLTRDFKASLTALQEKRDACDRVLNSLKKMNSPEDMQTLLDKNASCYNKDAMIARVQKVKDEHKTCDDLFVKVKQATDSATKTALLSDKTAKSCYNFSSMQTDAKNAVQKEKLCDRALDQLKKNQNLAARESLLEKNRTCYNVSQMETSVEEMKKSRKTCDDLYLRLTEASDLDTQQKLLQTDSVAKCYNKAKMMAFVTTETQKKAKRDKECDKKYATLQKMSSTDQMMKLVEDSATCYNIDTMKTYFQTEKDKRKAF